MMGDAAWQTSGRRHHINVNVAVVVAAEGEQGAVWRKTRKRFLAARRAQTGGDAARFGRHPNVARVHERDLRGRDIGVTKHAGINAADGVGIGFGRQGRNGAGENGAHTNHEREKKILFHFVKGKYAGFGGRKGSKNLISFLACILFNLKLKLNTDENCDYARVP